MERRREEAQQEHPNRQDRGAAFFLTFLLLLLFSGLALAVAVSSHNGQVAGRSLLQDRQAFYIAEAGLHRARQALEAGTWTAASPPGNQYTESFGAGEYEVTIVDNGSNQYTVTSDAYVPNQTTPVAQRRVVETNLQVSTGGSNLSLGATASASSSQGGDTPDNANDGDLGTRWRASTKGSGEWLRIDFGSATEVAQVVIYEDANITGIAVEYSDNGSSWTAVPGLTGDGNDTDTTWTMDFTATSARYFRIVLTASDSNARVSVDEFESYASGGGSLTIDQDGEFTTTW